MRGPLIIGAPVPKLELRGSNRAPLVPDAVLNIRDFQLTPRRRCGTYGSNVPRAAAVSVPLPGPPRAAHRRTGARVVPDLPDPRDHPAGRTLRAWTEQFLVYFTTERANNGGTEAINGIIELHRRIARGFRNPANYRLRMILAAVRLTHPNLR